MQTNFEQISIRVIFQRILTNGGPRWDELGLGWGWGRAGLGLTWPVLDWAGRGLGCGAPGPVQTNPIQAQPRPSPDQPNPAPAPAQPSAPVKRRDRTMTAQAFWHGCLLGWGCAMGPQKESWSGRGCQCGFATFPSSCCCCCCLERFTLPIVCFICASSFVY